MELAICAVSDVTLLLIAWLRGVVAAAIAAAVCPEIPLTWFDRAWTSVFWLETDVDIEFAWVDIELAVLAFATTLADMATNEMAWAPAGATTKSVASAVMTCLATRRVEEGFVSATQEAGHFSTDIYASLDSSLHNARRTCFWYQSESRTLSAHMLLVVRQRLQRPKSLNRKATTHGSSPQRNTPRGKTRRPRRKSSV